jgi:hybrid cluster-associated redox disulfide protein
MSETIPSPKWTVADLLSRYPQTAAVFSRFRMACVGCTMAPFETLADAAAAYQLRPDVLLRDLRRACRKKSTKK